ncbi:hypothetical protein GCM10009647_077190 [Streptomyces sanglieri]
MTVWWGVNRLRKGTAANSLAALESIRAARPDLHRPEKPLRPYRHEDPPLGEEERGRAVLHPAYASQANPIEAHSGPLPGGGPGSSCSPRRFSAARPQWRRQIRCWVKRSARRWQPSPGRASGHAKALCGRRSRGS